MQSRLHVVPLISMCVQAICNTTCAISENQYNFIHLLHNREVTDSRTWGIFIPGYGIFHCDSMKHKVILNWITMKYTVSCMKILHVRESATSLFSITYLLPFHFFLLLLLPSLLLFASPSYPWLVYMHHHIPAWHYPCWFLYIRIPGKRAKVDTYCFQITWLFPMEFTKLYSHLKIAFSKMWCYVKCKKIYHNSKISLKNMTLFWSWGSLKNELALKTGK